jgi:hypothetical protein
LWCLRVHKLSHHSIGEGNMLKEGQRWKALWDIRG